MKITSAIIISFVLLFCNSCKNNLSNEEKNQITNELKENNGFIEVLNIEAGEKETGTLFTYTRFTIKARVISNCKVNLFEFEAIPQIQFFKPENSNTSLTTLNINDTLQIHGVLFSSKLSGYFAETCCLFYLPNKEKLLNKEEETQICQDLNEYETSALNIITKSHAEANIILSKNKITKADKLPLRYFFSEKLKNELYNKVSDNADNTKIVNLAITTTKNMFWAIDLKCE